MPLLPPVTSATRAAAFSSRTGKFAASGTWMLANGIPVLLTVLAVVSERLAKACCRWLFQADAVVELGADPPRLGR